MPDLGQIRHDGGALYVLLPRRVGSNAPIVQTRWVEVRSYDTALGLELRALESGTVIDHRALLERGEVLILRYPETKVTDAWLERLVDAAELMEGGR